MKTSKQAGTKTKAVRPSHTKSTSPREKATPSPRVIELKVGQRAPAFSLPDEKGKAVRLADCRGKKVILYFYPKDDTSGCTKEACAFRDSIEEIQENGAVVLGVSPDSVESHKKFVGKYELNFPLLSDANKTVVQAYGVWKEKSMYGRKYMGVERTTFVIDQHGKIEEIFRKVKVDGHIEEILSELD
ncbi:MAG: thioredoxin-dependent thiol peroxidase [Nitrospirales bacterium]|nr:thioredoxin-dependent thiol peroxidase [Nitrospirales bacterium]